LASAEIVLVCGILPGEEEAKEACAASLISGVVF